MEVHVVGQVHQVMDAIHRHRPDILLMDMRMIHQGGITTTASASAMADAPEVIMLPTFDHDDVMLRAVHAGPAGFLLKAASPQDIITHVGDVASGRAPCPPQCTSARRASAADAAREQRRTAQALVATLTARERDCGALCRPA